MFTLHNIGTDHPMYQHYIHLLSDNKSTPDSGLQVVIYQGIKPIAQFFGINARKDAKELLKILNAKSLFNQVA